MAHTTAKTSAHHRPDHVLLLEAVVGSWIDTLDRSLALGLGC